MIEYKELKEQIAALDDADINGSHSDHEIFLAEKALNVSLPSSFKFYLKEWGNISFGHVEFLGLTNTKDFSKSGYPNFVWYNLLKRNENDFPEKFIIFQSINNEFFSCLDIENRFEDGECKIIIWNNLDKCIEQKCDLNFNDYLLDEIDEYLN